MLQIRRTERRDRRLVLEAAFALGAAAMMVRIVSVATIQKLIERMKRVSIAGEDQSVVSRAAWAVEAASRRVPDATCLVRALALQAILARRGYDARLVSASPATAAKTSRRTHGWNATAIS